MATLEPSCQDPTFFCVVGESGGGFPTGNGYPALVFRAWAGAFSLTPKLANSRENRDQKRSQKVVNIDLHIWKWNIYVEDHRKVAEKPNGTFQLFPQL